MRAIGGYFGLELAERKEFHSSAIKLNSGRNAFEYILRAEKYKKVFIPFFTCDVLLNTINKLGLDFEFYTIDENLEANFDLNKLTKSDAFLYTNYFGVMDKYIIKLISYSYNLIIDNAQSFFSLPYQEINTFYSPRKFFGVPDGSYLYSNKILEINIDQDISFKRFEHLLKRIDLNAEEGYTSFVQNEDLIKNLPILKMSNLTQNILNSIDYPQIAETRRNNFRYLNKELYRVNKLKFEWDGQQVPLVYPFMTDNLNFRKKLLDFRIYTSQYWPNVLKWTSPNSIEYTLAQNIIHLPIDQRYNEADLDKILNLIN